MRILRTSSRGTKFRGWFELKLTNSETIFQGILGLYFRFWIPDPGSMIIQNKQW